MTNCFLSRVIPVFLLFSLVLYTSACTQFNKPDPKNKPVADKTVSTKASVEVTDIGEMDKTNKQLKNKSKWDLPPGFTQRVAINSVQPDTAKPDLSGTWHLNKELSDDPKEKMLEAMQEEKKSKGGGMGRRGGRGSGEGRGRGGGGKSRGSGSNRDILKFALSETLILDHKEPLLVIKNDKQQKQRVYTDFRTQSVSANGSINQKIVTASWEGDILIIETVSDTGPNMEQHYQLNSELKQLSIMTLVRTNLADKVISIYSVYQP